MIHKKRTHRGWTPARLGLYTWGAVAGAAIGVVGSALTSKSSSGGSSGASGAIAGGDDAAIQFQRDAFAKVQELLKPWVSQGVAASTMQGGLIGLAGAPEQQYQINQLQESPAFTSAKKLGENAILANASATGGLRGGNVQGALGQFDESLLGQMIQQQFANLGGISSLGESAAAGTGSAALSTANQSGMYAQNAGVATAGGILGSASATNGGISGIVNAAGTLAGKYLSGGSTSAPAAGGATIGPTPDFASVPVQGFD